MAQSVHVENASPAANIPGLHLIHVAAPLSFFDTCPIAPIGVDAYAYSYEPDIEGNKQCFLQVTVHPPPRNLGNLLPVVYDHVLRRTLVNVVTDIVSNTAMKAEQL